MKKSFQFYRPICTAIERASLGNNKIGRENLNQLEKMTDFIICDINTPLKLIKRYAEFIRKKTEIKEVKQVSEFIIEQVNSVSAYSENRFRFCKREEIHLKENFLICR